jgi:hypothetical protein
MKRDDLSFIHREKLAHVSKRKLEQKMKSPKIVAIALIVVSSASAQTKDQCAVIAKGMLPMVTAITGTDQTVQGIDWNMMIQYTSGQLRASAEVARLAQANLVVALQRYRISLEDVAYQSQLCAR